MIQQRRKYIPQNISDVDNAIIYMRFANTEYKKRNMKIWDEIAPRYHKRWANKGRGPFQSTKKLVDSVGIKKDDSVLDVACGTGVVIREIQRRIKRSGYVIGVDTSSTAIKIAKRCNKETNVDFVNADAERFTFTKKFDIATCQYALFFFPNAQKTLRNIRRSLKKTGRIGISVHGRSDKVPFFSSILDVIIRYIPDYVPPGSLNLDRFGTKSSLYAEVKKAGFSKIVVKEFIFYHNPGKFEDYWRNYLRYIAKPAKEKITELSNTGRRELRRLVKENTIQYTNKDGDIVFPWQVLILTAEY